MGGFSIYPKPFYKTTTFYVSVTIATLVILSVLWMMTRSPQPELTPLAATSISEQPPAIESDPDFIVVEIKGAISQPGVYEMPFGSRLIALIDKAGGLLELSDSNQINQAALLVDEESIYIPTIGEVTTTTESESELIDINSADATLLQTLPGIGPAKADAIIAYREATPFQTVDDLSQVDGIGDKTLEQLRPLIRVK
ncbi:ComEA family DNA-binding protein [Chryseomicrobium excrementi]|nr:ComEA family DNA-binding protein [Chryseomicrobium excrementi]